MPELYEALIALVSILMASALRFAVTRLRAAQDELKYRRDPTPEELFKEGVKNIRVSVTEVNKASKSIIKTCIETGIDRVLILVAVNGDTNPQRATVLWDHNMIEEPWEYDEVKLDDDYRSKLDYIAKNHYLSFKTSEAANTLIGGYYEDEGVRESVWCMISKKKSIDTDQVAYIYMSASTHGDIDIGSDEIRGAQNIAVTFRKILEPHGFSPT